MAKMLHVMLCVFVVAIIRSLAIFYLLFCLALFSVRILFFFCFSELIGRTDDACNSLRKTFFIVNVMASGIRALAELCIPF